MAREEFAILWGIKDDEGERTGHFQWDVNGASPSSVQASLGSRSHKTTIEKSPLFASSSALPSLRNPNCCSYTPQPRRKTFLWRGKNKRPLMERCLTQRSVSGNGEERKRQTPVSLHTIRFCCVTSFVFEHMSHETSAVATNSPFRHSPVMTKREGSRKRHAMDR